MGIHEGEVGEALMLNRDSTLTDIFGTTPAVDWR